MRSDEDEKRAVRAEEGRDGEGSAQPLAGFHVALRSHQVKLIFNNVDCTD